MDRDKIIAFCAEFWQVEAELIVDTLKLDDKSLPNNSSIRFYQFIAQLESRCSVRVSDVNGILTFGDLLKDIENSSP